PGADPRMDEEKAAPAIGTPETAEELEMRLGRRRLDRGRRRARVDAVAPDGGYAAVAHPRLAPVPGATEERQTHVLVVALQEHPAHVLAPARGQQQVDDALRVPPAVDVVAHEAHRVPWPEPQAVQQSAQLAWTAVDVADGEESLAAHGTRGARSRTRAARASSSSRIRIAALYGS